jgi:cell division septation protein DedD
MTADGEPALADKGRDTESPAQLPGEMAAGAIATVPEATSAVPLARDAKPPQPAPVSVKTAPTSPAAPPAGSKAPAVDAPGGGWAVQVGAFGSADTARTLVKELGGAGYRAFVSPVSRDGRTLFRVRVGPEGDRASAEQLLPRLKARGLPATVVRND